LGISQTKRLQAIDGTLIAGSQSEFIINTAEDPCNIHGLIIDIWISGATATLPSFGQWALTMRPRLSTAGPGIATSTLNLEADNPIFWMLGTWMVAGIDKAHVGGAPRTSRNCPRGGRLTIGIQSSALSAGVMRIHGVATWFETIK